MSKLIFNGILAGIISGGGIFIASVADHGSLSKSTVTIALVTALVSMAKDMQSHLTEPTL